MIEDTARFVWGNAPLYRRLRSIRHRLHEITKTRYARLVEARDSRSDAGRVIREEASRNSVAEAASANMRRAQEAVRVLEEYAKVFSSKAAGEFKKIRYQLYEEEKEILKMS